MIGLATYDKDGNTVFDSDSFGSKIIAIVDTKNKDVGSETIDLQGAKNVIAFADDLDVGGQKIDISIDGNILSWRPSALKPLLISEVFREGYFFMGYHRDGSLAPKKIICVGF